MASMTAETDQMKCIAVRVLFSSATFCLQKYYPMDLRFEKGLCKMLWSHNTYLEIYEILKIDVQ